MPLPSTTKQLDSRSARTLVYERLREWIEDGTLTPGEVLKDSEIAERFGISRTPVREALQMLGQLGAVETARNRYTRVSAADPQDAALLHPPLAALEAVAAELGTPRVTETDIANMREANERLREAALSKDPIGAREADRAFHNVLVERAENHFLSITVDWLQLHMRRLDALYFSHLGPSLDSYEEHRQIIDAAARGDIARARDLTRRNFERGIADLDKLNGEESRSK